MAASSTASAPSEGKKPWSITKFVHPLIVLRDNLRKRFLNRRTGANGKDSRVVRRGRSARPAPEGTVKLTPTERQIKHCQGSLNLWYECEDYLCNKYWMNDGTWQREGKPPKAATIIQLQLPKDEQGFAQRCQYMESRPKVEYETQVRQLLLLSENESIQRMRSLATEIGPKQLEHASIQNLADLLRLVGLSDWQDRFDEEGVDLKTAFFMRDADFKDLGLKLGERIRLNQVLEVMRKLDVVRHGGVDPAAAVVRNTRFIKGDIVEHFREADCLIRRGKVVGVHTDDIANGVYYTVSILNDAGNEFQTAERKLDWPGEWENWARAKGRIPIFNEGDIPQEPEDTGEASASEDNADAAYTSEQAHEASEHAQSEYDEQTPEYGENHAEAVGDGDEPVATEETYVEETALEEQTTYEEAQYDETAAADAEYSGRDEPLPVPTTEEYIEEELPVEEPVDQVESSSPREFPPGFVSIYDQSHQETSYTGEDQEMPMYAMRSRMGSLAAKNVDSRNPSIVSTMSTFETEEMVNADDGDVGPSPDMPGEPRRQSSVSMRSSSVVSQVPIYEAEDIDDGDDSGMNQPPPPIPYRASSTGSEYLQEAPVETMAELEDDDREDSGMGVPPPLPVSRNNSILRRESSASRVSLDNRRVSILSGLGPPPPLPPSRRASSGVGSMIDEAQVEEMEPMEVLEEAPIEEEYDQQQQNLD